MKRFLATLLMVCICISMTTTAFAANESSDLEDSLVTEEDWTTIELPDSLGDEVTPLAIGGTETWGIGSRSSDWFTFTGNNLTPTKTMGASGKLIIQAYFSSDVPLKLRVQIREAGTKKVLKEWTSPATTNYDPKESDVPSLKVSKGQKIQISFRVLDKNGNYNANRKLEMLYSYTLYPN